MSELIPKAACFSILGEGQSASLRSVDSQSRRHRLCAAVCSFGSDGQGCEKVDQSPHGRDGHAPVHFRWKVQFQWANGLIRSRQTPAARFELFAATARAGVIASGLR